MTLGGTSSSSALLAALGLREARVSRWILVLSFFRWLRVAVVIRLGIGLFYCSCVGDAGGEFLGLVFGGDSFCGFDGIAGVQDVGDCGHLL